VTLNIFQQRVLERTAALADAFPCIKTLFVLGSVARGETATCNDVDLSVDYFGIPEMARERVKGDAYGKFQATFEDWAIESSEHFGGPFRWAHIYVNDPEDNVRKAIRKAALSPVAVQGRAMMVATPRIKPLS
jgi:hypothetical protein